MKEVYFHEDDYCQVEVLPLANLQFCARQAGDIAAFSEEHKLDVGWADIYVRSTAPKPMAHLALPLSDVREALAPHFEEADAVFTGYGSHREKCNDVFAFIASDHTIVFVQAELGRIVSAVWLNDSSEQVLQLPRSDELLLADWRHDFVCPLRDVGRIKTFCRSLD